MGTGVCSVNSLHLGLVPLRKAFKRLHFPRLLVRPMDRPGTSHGLMQAAQAAMRLPQEFHKVWPLDPCQASAERRSSSTLRMACEREVRVMFISQ
jgi:hypothetical protein